MGNWLGRKDTSMIPVWRWALAYREDRVLMLLSACKQHLALGPDAPGLSQPVYCCAENHVPAAGAPCEIT
ncbi:MAG: hypothetical protein ABI748_13080, partial [Dokdonella sp.]